MLVKQKVAIIERHMTPFWKEERWGYNISQNEQNLFFWDGPPPITLAQAVFFYTLKSFHIQTFHGNHYLTVKVRLLVFNELTIIAPVDLVFEMWLEEPFRIRHFDRD